MTFLKLFLNLKSVNPEQRYWHFSGTRYTETPFFNNRGFQSKKLSKVWTFLDSLHQQFSANFNFRKLKEFIWIFSNNSEVSSYLLGHMYITFLKGYDVGFLKEFKLSIAPNSRFAHKTTNFASKIRIIFQLAMVVCLYALFVNY
jgi:hypothetical protein